MKEPGVIVLVAAKEDVQLVVAQHTLRALIFHEPADPFDHRGTARPAIHQIADEDKTSPLRMSSVAVVSQSLP